MLSGQLFSQLTPQRVAQLGLWWVRISCYLCLLSPLVNPPGVVYPQVFGKTLYFFSILTFSIPGYALTLFYSDLRPKASPILLGCGIYVLIYGITTAIAYNPALSFWGYPARSHGMWALIHYTYFFLLLSLLHHNKDWHSMVRFSISISLLVSLGALHEKYFPGNSSSLWGDRTGSFLGNPAYLSSYLLFNFFLALWRLRESKTWVWRISLSLTLIIQVTALGLAATRGALVALILSLGLLWLMVLMSHQDSTSVRRALSYLLLIFIATAIIFFYLGHFDFANNIPGLNRLINSSFDDYSLRGRLIVWRITISGILEYPFFGWGPENFMHLFDKFYDPRLLAIPLSEFWFDRPHNQLLEIIATTGLIGLGAFLSLLGLTIIQLNLLRRATIIDDFYFATAFSIMAAYLIQNLFLFDHPSSLIMLYFCLAWWNSMAPASLANSAMQKVGTCMAYLHEPRFPAFYIIVITGLGAFIYWILLIAAPITNAFFVQRGFLDTSADTAIASFQTSQLIPCQYPDMTPWYFARKAILAAEGNRSSRKEAIKLLQGADTALREHLVHYPAISRYYFLLTQIQVLLAVEDDQHLQQALNDIQHALKLSPKRQEFLHLKGRILTLLGQYQDAVDVLREAVALEPRVSLSWQELAKAQYKAGDIDQAIISLRAADSINVQNFVWPQNQ